MGKKTVEFDDGWADELIADGTMTKEEVDRLMQIIIKEVANWEVPDEKGNNDATH
jgi:hypothetical protein